MMIAVIRLASPSARSTDSLTLHLAIRMAPALSRVGRVQRLRPTPKAPQQALVPTGDTFNGTHTPSETHGGEDVPLYATGQGSERARGVIEQSSIFDIIMGAFGLRR